MTVEQILGAIPSLQRDELRRVQLYAERYLKYKTSREFAPGLRVSFFAEGRTITGRVVRVNKSTVTVQPDNDNRYHSWRVAPSFLTVL